MIICSMAVTNQMLSPSGINHLITNPSSYPIDDNMDSKFHMRALSVELSRRGASLIEWAVSRNFMVAAITNNSLYAEFYLQEASRRPFTVLKERDCLKKCLSRKWLNHSDSTQTSIVHSPVCVSASRTLMLSEA